MLAGALKKYDPAAAAQAESGTKDKRFVYEAPAGGAVIEVTAKVLGGYDPAKGTTAIYQNALGNDHLWLRKDEAEALVRGELPQSVKLRLVRFHLIDNTRGEPPFWREDEIKRLDMALKDGRLSGTVHLETKKGDRGYDAALLGSVETKDGKLTRFDAVARGQFWGEGTYSRNAPNGKFPFAVAFRLAEPTETVRKVPPGGARGNLAAYLR